MKTIISLIGCIQLTNEQDLWISSDSMENDMKNLDLLLWKGPWIFEIYLTNGMSKFLFIEKFSCSSFIPAVLCQRSINFFMIKITLLASSFFEKNCVCLIPFYNFFYRCSRQPFHLSFNATRLLISVDSSLSDFWVTDFNSRLNLSQITFSIACLVTSALHFPLEDGGGRRGCWVGQGHAFRDEALISENFKLNSACRHSHRISFIHFRMGLRWYRRRAAVAA